MPKTNSKVVVPLTTIKAAIFDIDGTMVDNMEYHKKAWKMFYNIHQLRITKDILRLLTQGGKRNDEILREVFGIISKDLIKQYGSEKEQLYRNMYTKKIKPIKGLIDTLNYFKDNGICLAVATSATKVNMDLILKSLHIDGYFQVTVCGDEVTKGKPNPEIFLTAAERLHLRPPECVVFEDSVSGISAAHQAGMTSIGVLSGESRERLRADYFINNFDELEFVS
ncbi:MAG: HAD family phosphatase [bacterium]